MQYHGVVESEVDGHHWDLGSIPRSPKCLLIFFSHVILCRFLKAPHHVTPALNMPSGYRHASKGQEVILTMHSVNQQTLDPRSQRRLGLMGLRFLNKPHCWPRTPLFWFIFFSFILYFPFYLLTFFLSNYYYYH